MRSIGTLGSISQVVDELVEERESLVQNRFHLFQVDSEVLVRHHVPKTSEALEQVVIVTVAQLW